MPPALPLPGISLSKIPVSSFAIFSKCFNEFSRKWSCSLEAPFCLAKTDVAPKGPVKTFSTSLATMISHAPILLSAGDKSK